MRRVLVVLHRWAGLSIAGFLIVAGLTGSLIAFQTELDSRLNPDLFRIDSRGAPLPVGDLVARVEAWDARVRVRSAPVRVGDGFAASLFIRPRVDAETGKPFDVEYDQVFADPVTGSVLGVRKWGAVHLDRRHLMPLIYRLHNSLLIPGPWGRWIMGGVALIWLFDCFFGFALTLPRGTLPLARWWPAWRVRPSGTAYRLNVDLHRAGGLWLWGLLFMLALSGIQLNLDREVFRPVVELFSPVARTPFETRGIQPADETGALPFSAAVRRGAEIAAGQGLVPPSRLSHYIRYGLYLIEFGGPQHQAAAGLGPAYAVIDNRIGSLLGLRIPGRGTAGEVFTQIQFPLHSGHIIGLPGRIVISVMGVVVVILSMTGAVIWWKKRGARQVRAARTTVVAE
ncbi:MAG TPA: peptidase [Rhodospirillaceae bacterium]|nr:peptidase [Rhodospirillaceae bacterium]